MRTILVMLLIASIGNAADLPINFIEDFVGSSYNNRVWTFSTNVGNFGASIATSETYANGNILLTSGTNSGAYAELNCGGLKWIDISKNFVLSMRIRLSATNNSVYKMSLYKDTTNRVTLSCSNSSTAAYWTIQSYNDSLTNSTKILVSATTTKSILSGFVKLKFARWGSVIKYYIDDTFKGTIPSAKIPSGNFELIPIQVKTVSGSATKGVYVDYIYFYSSR